MNLESNGSHVELVDFSFHWLCLKKEDFHNVLNYIQIMETQFANAERLIGLELTAEDTSHYYDFDEVKWSMYKDLAFLGLVTDTEWEDTAALKDMLDYPDQFNKLDYLTLCKLMAISTGGTSFSDGFFDRKIKNKTVLKLLQAISKSLDLRDGNK